MYVYAIRYMDTRRPQAPSFLVQVKKLRDGPGDQANTCIPFTLITLAQVPSMHYSLGFWHLYIRKAHSLLVYFLTGWYLQYLCPEVTCTLVWTPRCRLKPYSMDQRHSQLEVWVYIGIHSRGDNTRSDCLWNSNCTQLHLGAINNFRDSHKWYDLAHLLIATL